MRIFLVLGAALGYCISWGQGTSFASSIVLNTTEGVGGSNSAQPIQATGTRYDGNLWYSGFCEGLTNPMRAIAAVRVGPVGGITAFLHCTIESTDTIIFGPGTGTARIRLTHTNGANVQGNSLRVAGGNEEHGGGAWTILESPNFGPRWRLEDYWSWRRGPSGGSVDIGSSIPMEQGFIIADVPPASGRQYSCQGAMSLDVNLGVPYILRRRLAVGAACGPFGESATDGMHSSHCGIEVLTSGVSFTSASGTDYSSQVIEGTVEFQDYSGPKALQIYFQLLDANGEVYNNMVTLDENGKFSVPVFGKVGDFCTLSIKTGHWLKRKSAIFLLSPKVTGVDFSLVNGDINGDDYIGTDDYLILNGSFDKSTGQIGFVPQADLTGNGYVGTDDYLILNNNFDRSGD